MERHKKGRRCVKNGQRRVKMPKTDFTASPHPKASDSGKVRKKFQLGTLTVTGQAFLGRQGCPVDV